MEEWSRFQDDVVVVVAVVVCAGDDVEDIALLKVVCGPVAAAEWAAKLEAGVRDDIKV